ncbi:hypothetical protein CO058_02855 [candidate division WWE3 bacterium CG_4_9_14_0_2_um_filter_35_11]|uniref:Uncharacterized protein n=1 Tax=candidate division WWE3 bacterium CG_4_9_14_0_2_um_filter_35_11 TaxID=1975077 RepID=A0A2M8EL99_UNCKA|nr:MAG: hypothetical protein COV25_01785 [candidate division WWE3 bacterium CG10_big_fil_rev_8_21_14_0_10_35_32]PJC23522.1 MAG: hypothetical protein CO058_02855 [candidate division WWE3 bacterium CG_4_9_14_0_2_um_filter_35_11]
MDIVNNLTIISQIEIYTIAKWLLEIFLFVYSIISVVVIRQIKFMTITIKSDTNKLIFFFAYFHLAVVLIITLITSVIL